MTSATFSGHTCWSEERIKSVFNLDAIAIDPVNFLATHTPIDRVHYTNLSLGLDNTGEERLLSELQRLADDDEYGFVVVEGMPGSGKSHLIRWLKEQYARQLDQRASREVVLLIERSNNSLRGALRQIVESAELRETGIYEEQGLAEQIDRLRHAADVLSLDTLPESLLTGLQEGANVVRIPDEPDVERLLLNDAAANILLDQTFRAHLKRPGGPIERLAGHLAEGRSTRTEPGAPPQFLPEDILLTPEQSRLIEHASYPEVRLLARRFVDIERSKPREQYASFLNRRLNFAVGRATSLSTNDVKEVFNDIRRALRARGYQLMLFIEDVTSFTGIDSGLIDVLTTQHTGQENTKFARLISVVGITDDFFGSRFPDNLKQRVTHHLQLSSADHTTAMMEQPEAIAELASRYLNATRLEEAELRNWTASGARPDDLPIACNNCRYKVECHACFGFVALGERDDETRRLGLYPFNRSALQTAFDSLGGRSRTPRALLTNVVEKILVRHGWKVKQGTFPPSRSEMGNEYALPTLLETGGHLRVIRSEAPRDSERLESLLVLWGDRTATSKIENDSRTVGSLPEGVFRAFQLPFIAGTTGESRSGTTDSTETNKPVHRVDRVVVQPVNPRPEVVLDPVLHDIQNWRTGQPLQYYETLRKDLIAFALDAIDWESYKLSPLQINERAQARRFRIEGQHSRTIGDTHELSRSDELQYALQAVHALRDIANLSRSRADIAGHLLSLRAWLDLAEPGIVEFVRKPVSSAPNELQFTDLVIADALHLASLGGHLQADTRSSDALGLILLQQGSAAIASSLDQFSADWRDGPVAGAPVRSKEWSALLRRISARRAHTIWRNLLESVSRSQGGASGARFIDAHLLLQGIERFRKGGWSLDQFKCAEELSGVNSPWDVPIKVVIDLRESFGSVLDAERVFLGELKVSLLSFLDGETPEAVLDEVRALLKIMRTENLTQPIDRLPVNGNQIQDQIVRLNNLIEDRDVSRAAARLSNADRTAKLVQGTIAMFVQVEEILTKYEPIIAQRLQNGRSRLEELCTAEVVRAELQEITHIIDDVIREHAMSGKQS